MCWLCVAPESLGPNEGGGSADQRLRPKAGWLTGDRYADWPAWQRAGEAADAIGAIETAETGQPSEAPAVCGPQGATPARQKH